MLPRWHRRGDTVNIVRPETRFAPYSSSQSVIEVINRLRDVGLPDPLTMEGLGSIGVPPTVASPTMRAIKFLGLVDEDGNQQAALQKLAVSSSDEYPSVLSEIVKSAYAEVFAIVDPAKHDFEKVSDAFRPYTPQKQRRRMVRLFLGLCEEANLVPEQPKRQQQSEATRQRKRTVSDTAQDEQTQQVEPPLPAATPSNGTKLLINSFVAELPDSDEWTTDHRQRWLAAVTSAVDLMITVSDATTDTVARDDP